MNALPLRPHHGMCLSFFEGKGYSDAFTVHLAGLLARLEEEDPMVRIVSRTDEVCAACPHNEGGVCRTAEKVDRYDRAVLDLCGILPGAEMRWSAFSAMVRLRVIDAGKRERVCGDCEWNDICVKHQARHSPDRTF